MGSINIRGTFKVKTLGSGTGENLLTSNTSTKLINSIAPINTANFLSTTLTSGQMLVGNASHVATAYTLSGDVTVSNLGVTAITAGSIVNADVNASAAIAVSKLAALTASRAVATDASGFITPSATTATELGYVSGVTSAIQTQLNTKVTDPMTTIGDIIIRNGSNVTSRLGIGSAGQVLTVSGGVPAWAAVTGLPSGGSVGQAVLNTAPGTGAWTTLTISNISGITATAANINILAGTATTAAQIGYLSSTTSDIQTQLNSKQATITGAASTIASSNLSTNVAVVTDGSGKIATSATTSTELGYVSGVTSSIQTQLNNKLNNALNSGYLLVGNASNVATPLAPGTNGYVLTVVGGTPTWSAGAATAPGGINTELQLNSAGSFGGAAITAASNVLTLGLSTTSSTSQTLTMNSNAVTQTTLNINALASGTATVAGGKLVLTSGNGNTTGAGGLISLTSGAGGTTGNGGALTLTGGAGGATSGTGGALTMSAGSATAGNSGGGNVNVNGGASTGNATAGIISLNGGSNSSTGFGGGVNLTGGSGGGSGSGTGGSLNLTGGAGGQTGNGGSITVQGGTGGSAANTGNGGNIYLQVGAPSGTGKWGNLSIFDTTGSFGTGEKVIFIADRTTAPTSNPTGGGIMYSESGLPNWRDTAGNTYAMTGGGNIQTALVNLSNGQIASGNTTPITLIAAPGAGKVIQVISVLVKWVFGTVAWATNTTYQIQYNGAASGICAASNSMGNASTSYDLPAPLGLSNYTATTIENKAVELKVNTGNPTGGTGCTAVVKIEYIIKQI